MEKGRVELAHSMRADAEVFVLPDMAEELSRIEGMDISAERKLEMRQRIEDVFLDRSERNHNITSSIGAKGITTSRSSCAPTCSMSETSNTLWRIMPELSS